MKNIYFFILLLLSCLGASARMNSVVVHHRDGSINRIGMESELSARISGDDLVFTSPLGQVSVPAADVANWTFSSKAGDPWSGIDEAVADAGFAVSAGRIDVYGHASATLFALDGSVAATAGGDGASCVIVTSGLAAGVYVLAVDGRSFKILLNR